MTDQTAAHQAQAPDEAPAALLAEPRPFTQFLLEQSNGSLHAELSEGLQELVAAVMDHEKAGSLTLTIKIAPAKNGQNVILSDEVKVKAPEADRPTSLFFVDGANNLSRRDPRQPELPLKELSSTRKAG